MTERIADDGATADRAKSAVLWGAVGFMSFLALFQGYAVVVEPLLSFAGAIGIAVLVAAGAGGSAYALEHRVAAWSARRARRARQEEGEDESTVE